MKYAVWLEEDNAWYCLPDPKYPTLNAMFGEDWDFSHDLVGAVKFDTVDSAQVLVEYLKTKGLSPVVISFDEAQLPAKEKANE